MQRRAGSVTVAAAGCGAPRNALPHRSENNTTVSRILEADVILLAAGEAMVAIGPGKFQNLEPKTYHAFLFNPGDGTEQTLSNITPDGTGAWQSPEFPIFRDWVVVLDQVCAFSAMRSPSSQDWPVSLRQAHYHPNDFRERGRMTGSFIMLRNGASFPAVRFRRLIT